MIPFCCLIGKNSIVRNEYLGIKGTQLEPNRVTIEIEYHGSILRNTPFIICFRGNNGVHNNTDYVAGKIIIYP